jgi:error-prone DNA polymerase
MALIDRNGVYGAPRFFMAAKKNGVKAIIGSELVLEDSSALGPRPSALTGAQRETPPPPRRPPLR